MANDEVKSSSFTDKLVPILLLASVGLAFAVGVLWQKVSNMESGNVVKPDVQAETTTQPQQQATVSLDKVKALLNEDLIKIGDNDSLIIVEVSDPSCPYCSIASGKNSELNKSVSNGMFTLVADGGEYVAPVPELRKLAESGKATYIYLYAPGHGAGEMGAKAMYCANEKGKYWDVHDLLASGEGYDLLNNTVKNDTSKSADLAQFLSGVIDSSFMKSCLDSGKYDDRLDKDYQLAKTLGFRGTPYFILNDNPFPGAYNYNDMKPVIDGLLSN